VPTRAIGAFVAAGVSAAFLAVCLVPVVASSSPNGPFWLFSVAAVGCGIGIPVAAVLGWVETPAALAPGPPSMRTRLKHSLAGVTLGLSAVAGTLAFANDPTARLGLGAQATDIALDIGFAVAVGAVMFGIGAIYGLLGLGLPALLYGVLVETTWLRLFRRLAGVRPSTPPSTAPVVASPLPRFSAFVLVLATAGLVVTVAASVPAVVDLARANDPPGILYGALLAWFLTLLGPGLIGLATLRRHSWRLLVSPVPALLVIAILVGPPIGLTHAAAAIALGIAGLAARGVDRVAPSASILVAVLLLAAPLVLQVATEQACWDIYGEGFGLEMRLSPSEPNGPTEVPILSSGCVDHAYTGAGAALGAGALALAGVTAAAANGFSFHSAGFSFHSAGPGVSSRRPRPGSRAVGAPRPGPGARGRSDSPREASGARRR
jgi:hypothetical protein